MDLEALSWEQVIGVNFNQTIYTNSPNATINVVQFAAKGSGTNIGIALTPKGTGYISAQVPDGTAAGGNARGANAVDLHTKRTTANAVASGECSALIGGQQSSASGANSACVGGTGNTASGIGGVIIGGNGSTASGQHAIVLSRGTASGTNSIAGGSDILASGPYSICFGIGGISSADGSICVGRYGRAHRLGMFAHSSTLFSTSGDVQYFIQPVANKTTNNTPTELFCNQAFGNVRVVLIAGSILHATVFVSGSKSDGSAVASYQRQVTIKRVGNTTSLVGTVNTIGVDEAAGTSLSITADDANDSLKIEVTGISGETWRWDGVVHGTELYYGT